jgi:hypothetical protein
MISVQLYTTLFPQLFQCDSEGNSRLGRKEKWRKWGESSWLRKKGGFSVWIDFSQAHPRLSGNSAQVV